MNKQDDFKKISAAIDDCQTMEQLQNCETLFDSYEFMYSYDENLKELIQQYFKKLAILIINTRQYNDLQTVTLDELNSVHNLTERYDKGEKVSLLDNDGNIMGIKEWSMLSRYVEFKDQLEKVSMFAVHNLAYYSLHLD